MSLAILFHFLCTQHVSDINISIIRSLRLCCWITTLVVLFSVRCVLEICVRLGLDSVRVAGWSSASACNNGYEDGYLLVETCSPHITLCNNKNSCADLQFYYCNAYPRTSWCLHSKNLHFLLQKFSKNSLRALSVGDPELDDIKSTQARYSANSLLSTYERNNK